MILLVMPQYSLHIWNGRDRYGHPRKLDLPSIEAAHAVALQLARVLIAARSSWRELPIEARKQLVIEIVDEAGQTVLTVPFTEAEGPIS
jgi:hypothetical protein